MTIADPESPEYLSHRFESVQQLNGDTLDEKLDSLRDCIAGSSTQVGPLEWTIDLKCFPPLADNWFDPSGHTSAGQRILSIGKESELDSLPKSNEE